MQHKRSKLLPVVLGISLLIGLISLLAFRRRSPQAIIRKHLSANSIPEQTVKYWIAVSAYETNGWSSQVFKDSRNLFDLIVPGKPGLSYGEHQTIYSTLDEAAEDLVKQVLHPFKYPNVFTSLQQMTDLMKSKGYYGIDKATYYIGAAQWYNKLFA